MQNIGLDLGYIRSSSYYGKYIINMLKELEKIDTENRYTIFSSHTIEFKNPNFVCKKHTNNRSLIEDIQFTKSIHKNRHNLVIFFDHNRRTWYRRRHYSFLESLQEMSYPSHERKSYIGTHFFMYFLEKYIKKSDKILCFDARTKEEINEGFDKKEENIAIVPGFFFFETEKTIGKEDTIPLIDANIGDYLIYEGGTGNNKNLEKLIKAIKLINKDNTQITLYILGDELLNDLQLRETIVQYGAVNMVQLFGEVSSEKKAHYYHNAIGVVLPSLYESFPFSLTNAIKYNKKIVASNLPSLKNIFGESIDYFNPLSINQISNKLLQLKNQPEPNYKAIHSQFSPLSSAQRLRDEIED